MGSGILQAGKEPVVAARGPQIRMNKMSQHGWVEQVTRQPLYYNLYMHINLLSTEFYLFLACDDMKSSSSRTIDSLLSSVL